MSGKSDCNSVDFNTPYPLPIHINPKNTDLEALNLESMFLSADEIKQYSLLSKSDPQSDKSIKKKFTLQAATSLLGFHKNVLGFPKNIDQETKKPKEVYSLDTNSPMFSDSNLLSDREYYQFWVNLLQDLSATNLQKTFKEQSLNDYSQNITHMKSIAESLLDRTTELENLRNLEDPSINVTTLAQTYSDMISALENGDSFFMHGGYYDSFKGTKNPHIYEICCNKNNNFDIFVYPAAFWKVTMHFLVDGKKRYKPYAAYKNIPRNHFLCETKNGPIPFIQSAISLQVDCSHHRKNKLYHPSIANEVEQALFKMYEPYHSVCHPTNFVKKISDDRNQHFKSYLNLIKTELPIESYKTIVFHIKLYILTKAYAVLMEDIRKDPSTIISSIQRRWLLLQADKLEKRIKKWSSILPDEWQLQAKATVIDLRQQLEEIEKIAKKEHEIHLLQLDELNETQKADSPRPSKRQDPILLEQKSSPVNPIVLEWLDERQIGTIEAVITICEKYQKKLQTVNKDPLNQKKELRRAIRHTIFTFMSTIALPIQSASSDATKRWVENYTLNYTKNHSLDFLKKTISQFDTLASLYTSTESEAACQDDPLERRLLILFKIQCIVHFASLQIEYQTFQEYKKDSLLFLENYKIPGEPAYEIQNMYFTSEWRELTNVFDYIKIFNRQGHLQKPFPSPLKEDLINNSQDSAFGNYTYWNELIKGYPALTRVVEQEKKAVLDDLEAACENLQKTSKGYNSELNEKKDQLQGGKDLPIELWTIAFLEDIHSKTHKKAVTDSKREHLSSLQRIVVLSDTLIDFNTYSSREKSFHDNTLKCKKILIQRSNSTKYYIKRGYQTGIYSYSSKTANDYKNIDTRARYLAESSPIAHLLKEPETKRQNLHTLAKTHEGAALQNGALSASQGEKTAVEQAYFDFNQLWSSFPILWRTLPFPQLFWQQAMEKIGQPESLSALENPQIQEMLFMLLFRPVILEEGNVYGGIGHEIASTHNSLVSTKKRLQTQLQYILDANTHFSKTRFIFELCTVLASCLAFQNKHEQAFELNPLQFIEKFERKQTLSSLSKEEKAHLSLYRAACLALDPKTFLSTEQLGSFYSHWIFYQLHERKIIKDYNKKGLITERPSQSWAGMYLIRFISDRIMENKHILSAFSPKDLEKLIQTIQQNTSLFKIETKNQPFTASIIFPYLNIHNKDTTERYHINLAEGLFYYNEALPTKIEEIFKNKSPNVVRTFRHVFGDENLYFYSTCGENAQQFVHPKYGICRFIYSNSVSENYKMILQRQFPWSPGNWYTYQLLCPRFPGHAASDLLKWEHKDGYLCITDKEGTPLYTSQDGKEFIDIKNGGAIIKHIRLSYANELNETFERFDPTLYDNIILKTYTLQDRAKTRLTELLFLGYFSTNKENPLSFTYDKSCFVWTENQEYALSKATPHCELDLRTIAFAYLDARQAPGSKGKLLIPLLPFDTSYTSIVREAIQARQNVYAKASNVHEMRAPQKKGDLYYYSCKQADDLTWTAEPRALNVFVHSNADTAYIILSIDAQGRVAPTDEKSRLFLSYLYLQERNYEKARKYLPKLDSKNRINDEELKILEYIQKLPLPSEQMEAHFISLYAFLLSLKEYKERGLSPTWPPFLLNQHINRYLFFLDQVGPLSPFSREEEKELITVLLDYLQIVRSNSITKKELIQQAEKTNSYPYPYPENAAQQFHARKNSLDHPNKRMAEDKILNRRDFPIKTELLNTTVPTTDNSSEKQTFLWDLIAFQNPLEWPNISELTRLYSISSTQDQKRLLYLLVFWHQYIYHHLVLLDKQLSYNDTNKLLDIKIWIKRAIYTIIDSDSTNVNQKSDLKDLLQSYFHNKPNPEEINPNSNLPKPQKYRTQKTYTISTPDIEWLTSLIPQKAMWQQFVPKSNLNPIIQQAPSIPPFVPPTEQDLPEKERTTYKASLQGAAKRLQQDYTFSIQNTPPIYSITSEALSLMKKKTEQALTNIKTEIEKQTLQLLAEINTRSLSDHMQKCPLFTWENCIEFLLAGTKSIYQKNNPSLTKENIANIAKQTLAILTLRAVEAQLHRIKNLILEIQNLNKDRKSTQKSKKSTKESLCTLLAEELDADCSFSTAKTPALKLILLIFAGQTGKIAKPGQIEMLNTMIEHDYGIFQGIMGIGKTEFIAPVWMLYTAIYKNKLAIFFIDSTLFPTCSPIIRSLIEKVSYKSPMTLDIDNVQKMTPEKLKLVHDIIKEMKNTQDGLLIVTPITFHLLRDDLLAGIHTLAQTCIARHDVIKSLESSKDPINTLIITHLKEKTCPIGIELLRETLQITNQNKQAPLYPFIHTMREKACELLLKNPSLHLLDDTVPCMDLVHETVYVPLAEELYNCFEIALAPLLETIPSEHRKGWWIHSICNSKEKSLYKTDNAATVKTLIQNGIDNLKSSEDLPKDIDSNWRDLIWEYIEETKKYIKSDPLLYLSYNSVAYDTLEKICKEPDSTDKKLAVGITLLCQKLIQKETPGMLNDIRKKRETWNDYRAKIPLIFSIFDLIKTDTEALGDEIDTMLAPNKETIYVKDSKVFANPVYADLLIDIYTIFLSEEEITLPSNNNKISMQKAIGLLSNEQPLLLQEDYEKAIAPFAAKKLVETLPVFKDNFNDAQKKILSLYLSDQIDPQVASLKECIDPAQADQYARFSLEISFLQQLDLMAKSPNPADQKVANLCAAARNFLCRVIPMALTLYSETKQGPSPKDLGKIIPYKGPAQPESTEYGHHWQTACGILQYYLSQDMTIPLFLKIVEELQKTARFFMEKNNEKLEDTIEQMEFKAISHIGLDEIATSPPRKEDETKITTILKKLRDNPKDLLRLLTIFVKKHATYSRLSFKSNGLNLADMVPLKGISGTIPHIPPYDRRLASNLFPQQGTQGAIIKNLLTEGKKPSIIPISFRKDKNTILSMEELLQKIHNGEYPPLYGIIDSSGLLKDIQGNQRSKALAWATFLQNYSQPHSIQAILFFEGDILYMHRVGNTQADQIDDTSPETLRTKGLIKGQYVLLYDKPHARGVNAQFPPNAVGVISVGEQDIFTEFSQALLRFREWIKGQKLNIIIDEKVKNHFQSGVNRDTTLTVEHILKHLIINETISSSKELVTAYEQLIDQIFDREALTIMKPLVLALATSTDASDQKQQANRIQKLEPFFSTKTDERPYEMHGSLSTLEQTTAMLHVLLDKKKAQFENALHPDKPSINLINDIDSMHIWIDEHKTDLPKEWFAEKNFTTTQTHEVHQAVQQQQIQMQEQKNTQQVQEKRLEHLELTLSQDTIEIENEFKTYQLETRQNFLEDPGMTEERLKALLASIENKNRKEEKEPQNPLLLPIPVQEQLKKYSYPYPYDQVFHTPIYGTYTFFHVFENTVLPIFHKQHRPALQILVVQNTNTNNYYFLLLSENEALHTKQLLETTSYQQTKWWLVNNRGESLTSTSRLEFPVKNPQIQRSLTEIAILNGDTQYLIRGDRQVYIKNWLKFDVKATSPDSPNVKWRLLSLLCYRCDNNKQETFTTLLKAKQTILPSSSPSTNKTTPNDIIISQKRKEYEERPGTYGQNLPPEEIKRTTLELVPSLCPTAIPHLGVEEQMLNAFAQQDPFNGNTNEAKQFICEQFDALDNTQCRYLVAWQIKDWLPKDKILALDTAEQLLAVSREDWKYFVGRQSSLMADFCSKMNNPKEDIPYLPHSPWCIEQIPDTLLHHISNRQISSLTKRQVDRILDPQSGYSEEFKKRVFEFAAPENLISHITADNLDKCHPRCLYLYQESIIQKIDNPHIIAQLEVIAEKSRSGGTREKAVPKGQWTSWLTEDQVQHVLPENARYLNKQEQIKKMNAAQLGAILQDTDVSDQAKTHALTHASKEIVESFVKEEYIYLFPSERIDLYNNEKIIKTIQNPNTIKELEIIAERAQPTITKGRWTSWLTKDQVQHVLPTNLIYLTKEQMPFIVIETQLNLFGAKGFNQLQLQHPLWGRVNECSNAVIGNLDPHTIVKIKDSRLQHLNTQMTIQAISFKKITHLTKEQLAYRKASFPLYFFYAIFWGIPCSLLAICCYLKIFISQLWGQNALEEELFTLRGELLRPLCLFSIYLPALFISLENQEGLNPVPVII